MKLLELKVRLDDLESMKDKLDRLAHFVRTECVKSYFFRSDKIDVCLEIKLQKIRNKKITILKLFHDEAKIQEAEEFETKNLEDIVCFLEKITFSPAEMIRKDSTIYSKNDVEIELTFIKGIGNFIELRLKNNSFTAKNKNILLSLVNELGLAQSLIVSKHYDDLLWQEADAQCV